MKSVIKTKKEEVKEKPFPKLMRVKKQDLPKGMESRVVLFSSPKCGTIVNVIPAGLCHEKIGAFSDSWAMRCFEDFEGTVKLSN